MNRKPLPLAVALLAATCAGALALPSVARAQDSSSDSVADAARRAKAQKEAAASKPAKIYTDEDVTKPKPNQEGLTLPATPTLDTAPPPGSEVSAQEQKDQRQNTSPADMPVEKVDSAKIKAAKAQLAQAEQDLKFAKRALALDQDSYYSNPNYKNDPAGKDKLDADQAQIDAKQAAVDQLRAQVEEMERNAKSDEGEAAPAQPDTPAPAAPATPPQS